MTVRKLIYLTGAAFLLLGVGMANAVTTQTQLPLPALSIPQFVEPLPLLEFEFINATNQDFSDATAGYGGTVGVLLPPPIGSTSFEVNAEEFQSQILPPPDPALGWPPAGMCTGGTASYTYGYRTTPLSPGIRPTYLGPVVLSERGTMVNPVYGNHIPDPTFGTMGVVQSNLPIDQTLDWASPEGLTGPTTMGLCGPDPATGDPTDPLCLNIPYLGPMPIATHLHGGELAPSYDGGPDAWFTPDSGHWVFDPVAGKDVLVAGSDGAPDYAGPGFPGYDYHYPNTQQESTIWFHDHALGITRLNVYAGLAGIQPIIDPGLTLLSDLPKLTDGFDIPLIIQDRTFDQDCEIMYDLSSNPQPNINVHPFWIPEFIGTTIVVNGKTWPHLEVEKRQYRFRLVNGSNARFYDLTLSGGLKFYVIATDDGYLENAVRTGNLIIGPGERYEVIVDFKNVKGQKNMPFPKVTMMNAARTPFPGGAAPVLGLTDTVMQFWVDLPTNTDPTTPGGIADTQIVNGSALRDPVANPIQPIATAVTPMPPPPAPAVGNITRQLTLNEVIGPGGPLELVVNNSKFNLALDTPGCNTAMCRETEIPAVGDTEIWEIINITADAHPMHTHLTSFQVLERIPFKASRWIANYDGLLRSGNVADGGGPPNVYNVRNADGAIGGNPAVGSSLVLKNARLPLAYEMGWKDVVIAYPGEVTRIAVRYGPTDAPVVVTATDPACSAGCGTGGNPACAPGCVPSAGDNAYDGFDPTSLAGDNVGYVWHCHIVDHEDNEMMRNFTVGTARQPVM